MESRLESRFTAENKKGPAGNPGRGKASSRRSPSPASYTREARDGAVAWPWSRGDRPRSIAC